MKEGPAFLRLLDRWRRSDTPAASGGYRAFVTTYDEIISADELFRRLPALNQAEKQSFESAIRSYEADLQGERLKIQIAGAKLIGRLRAAMPEASERRASIVSILIDHSGSMRGLRMLCAVFAADVVADILTQAGIRTELLGFTTASWKGGHSRQRWLRAGKPRNPGRLCDLRHIVYADAERSSPGVPWSIRLALRPDLLHENIDGEALEWAASRLGGNEWHRRAICVISDGAPVDDSTLDANDDQELLTKHLASVEQRLWRDGIPVGFIELHDDDYICEHQLSRRTVVTPDHAALSLLEIVESLILRLKPTASAPAEDER